MNAPTVVLIDGKRVIQWDSGERSMFLISAELFEEIIGGLNERDELLAGWLDAWDHGGGNPVAETRALRRAARPTDEVVS